MPLDIYEFYLNLEPNHSVAVDDEVQTVICPFTNPDTGEGFRTSWSLSADPSEVECLFCEYLSGRHPELAGPEHECDHDDLPPIGGGAHGGTHTVLEYQSCKVPLRTITAFGVRITVHEGIVADCYEAERRWRALGGTAWYPIRQGDTGSYNCRPSTGHSRAVAIDFNWNCLSGDTLVWTYAGLQRIEELAGTTARILTRDLVAGGGGRWVDAPIRDFGEREIFDVTLSRRGITKRIGATTDHRWFVRHNAGQASAKQRTVERPTGSLRPGDRLVHCFPPPQAHRTTVSSVGVAAGLVYGDGTRERNGGSVAYLFGEDLGELLSYFARPTIYQRPTDSGVPGVTVYGLPGAWKDRPSLDESAAYLLGWLAGYFAADGCVGTRGNPTITSASRDDLEFFRLVAAKVGIACGEVLTGKREGYGGVSEKHTLGLVASTVPEKFFIRGLHRDRFAAVERKAGDHYDWTVESVEARGVEPTYCALVEGTEAFTLDGWLLTGNSNPYRKPRPARGCPQDNRIRDFWRLCWQPLGYGWGGNWTSACDAMHISKVVNEGGDGILYRTHKAQPVKEWDEMASKEEIAQVVAQQIREHRNVALVRKVGEHTVYANVWGSFLVHVRNGDAAHSAFGDWTVKVQSLPANHGVWNLPVVDLSKPGGDISVPATAVVKALADQLSK